MRDLGEALGYSGRSAEQMVWSWERGRTQIPSADVPSIARALGITICELYGVEEGHAGDAGERWTRELEQLVTEPEREFLREVVEATGRLRERLLRPESAGATPLTR